ncbi:hypothetical protein MMC30_004173 [Trapelia coarctata]|nr:hypothetical protein [Trapelia coarctata]
MDRRIAEPELISSSEAQIIDRRNEEIYSELEKRRGGGGGGGRGGGSSSGGSSGGSSRGGSSSGGSSGSSGSSGGRSTSSTSSSPSYGGGRYYGGGSTSAYTAGARSPLGVAPFFIGGAALGFFPGLWLYGAYAYPYSHPYNFRNTTANQNQSLPVECVCAQYSACGCDDNSNSTYIDDLIGNGSLADMDDTLVRVTVVNGTKTLVINGTLPNGTDGATSAAHSSTRTWAENSGFWVVGAVVGLTVWAL